jgi:hypothetical protein
MPSPGSLLESTALLLLVTAAACGESATELADKAARQRAASPNLAEPILDGTVAPPVFTIQTRLGPSTALIEHMPPGFTPPPGQFYGFDVRATGFPPGRSFDFQTLARYADGGDVFLVGAGGGGVIPADGSFRTGGAANCPSRFSEIWVVVNVGGRKWAESPRFVPGC